MHLVFVAHYFPPMNSTGARRVTAFARHLVEFGHDVVVITSTKTAAHGALTEAVPRGVRVIELPRPTIHPSAPETQASSTSSSATTARRRVRRLLGRAIVAASGQLVDRQLAFMVRALRDSRVADEVRRCDAVVSTSPPWVTHLAARMLARRHRKPWIADYRDQFSNSPISTRALARPLERAVDKSLAGAADAVVVVSPAMRAYYARWNPHTHLIYNGFEPTAIADARQAAGNHTHPDRPFTFRFLGSYARGNPPRELLRAMARIAETHCLRFEVVGNRSEELVEDARPLSPALKGVLAATPKVSSDEALRLMADADALVLFETWDRSATQQKGIATTKVFEYVATGRPTVAAVRSDVEAVRILREAGLLVVASLDEQELVEAITELIDGDREWIPQAAAIDRYSRPFQTRTLERLLRDQATTKRVALTPR